MTGRLVHICLAAALLAAATPASTAMAQEPDRLCHWTGNEYVLLQVSNAGVAAHMTHEEDIYPAPAAGCPAGLATPTPTPTLAPSIPTSTPTPVQTPGQSTDEDYGVIPPPQRQDDEEDADDAGEDDESPDAASQTTGTLPTGTAARRTLPVTGGDPRLILLAGLGLLMAGLGVRLRLGPQR